VDEEVKLSSWCRKDNMTVKEPQLIKSPHVKYRMLRNTGQCGLSA
jgi:hypothetical protein